MLAEIDLTRRLGEHGPGSGGGICPGCIFLELAAAIRERLFGDGSGGRHLFAAIGEHDPAGGRCGSADGAEKGMAVVLVAFLAVALMQINLHFI